MNRLCLAVSLLLFPIMALADNSLSFAPPPSDFSVVFLSNLFGIVDGVLHGTGSQILGSLFAVFNAAVLALGGMIIMYTLVVSTLNTAQEGEMLGKKWSSIWIPVRSTIGLALLIPKASGYCLMQIFVMWVVVQGVGAADKVWDAALNYLNRGGVIIQGNSDPTIKLLQGGGTSGIAKGANSILSSVVCMIGLQTQLQTQRQIYLNQKGSASPSGPCAGSPSSIMASFCDTPVPNLISTVNAVDFQKTHSDTVLRIPLPNITDGVYKSLNGICGQMTWNRVPENIASLTVRTKTEEISVPNPFGGPPIVVKRDVTTGIGGLSESELETVKLSRAIAVQQMYLDLSSIAQTMVRNNPGTFNREKETTNDDFSDVAVQQYGVPQSISGEICQDKQTVKCILWGGMGDKGGAPLFNGTEFRGAILDYNGIMRPTLTLIQQAQEYESSRGAREFIREASTQGWIMAGSYFFNLVTLNVKASKNSDLVDSHTGLDYSAFKIDPFKDAFSNWTNKCSSGQYGELCTWFNGDAGRVLSILKLINNYNSSSGGMTVPDFDNNNLAVVKDDPSSTVYGFTANSTVLQLPNQPGQSELTFAQGMNIKFNSEIQPLPSLSFTCGEFKIWGLSAGCIGRVFAEIFYNGAFVPLYNGLIIAFGQIIISIIHTFLVIPLVGMGEIFKQGIQIISKPGVNPIVALAQMGTYYINFCANLWIELIMKSITAALIPIFGMFIFALLSLSLPLLLAWCGLMMTIGFNTAYYVPILPYMIFTFGSVGWLMSVIESMVAAPIVALAVTHPEGHDAFGKGETAIMILLNVFLRPSMMIIGYIAAIGLSYVSVWIINAGFDNAIGFIQGSGYYGTNSDAQSINSAIGGVQGGYKDWAGVYAYFFSIFMYTIIYITVVTKAFTLIAVLPDKVLRWVGGTPESYGTDTSQWGEEAKQKMDKASDETQRGQAQVDKKLSGHTTKAINEVAGGNKSTSSTIDAKSGAPKPSTPNKPEE